MNRDKEIIILMTATINPNGMVHTKLQDPKIRKLQYLDAINFYLNETKLKIVFCENSGYSIYNEIINPYKYERLEYIYFNGNNYNKNLGKCFGEVKIIEKVLQVSKFINESSIIIKITGRVKIQNINKIISYIRKNNNNDKLGFEIFRKGWIKSVCFFIPKLLLQDIIFMYGTKVKETEYNFETMLFDGIFNYKGIIKIQTIFPIIDGYSGTLNKPYINKSIIQRKVDHYSAVLTLNNIKNLYKYNCYIKKSFYIFLNYLLNHCIK